MEGEWLLVKHSRFWELRRSELPERTVRELERKTARGQRLTLNDYAALAREMGPTHRRRVETPDGYTVRFSLLPLDGHLAVLRFWASLNGAQQTAALRDGVLPIAALSLAQQRMFWRSAWEGVLFGTFYAKQWAFEEDEHPLPLPALTIALAPAEKYQLVGSEVPVSLIDTRELAERTVEDLKRWQPGREITIRPVQVVQCRYGFLLFPNLQYTGRFDLAPPTGW